MINDSLDARTTAITMLTVLVIAAGTDRDLQSRGRWVCIPTRMSRMQWTYGGSFMSMMVRYTRAHTHYRWLRLLA